MTIVFNGTDIKLNAVSRPSLLGFPAFIIFEIPDRVQRVFSI